MVGLGMAWRGAAQQGMAWHGQADKTRRGAAGHHKARFGWAVQARRGKARPGMAGLDLAGPGNAG